jgi:hypothetical protein
MKREERERMKGKILKDPSPYTLPRSWRGEQKDEKILTSPHPCPLPQSGEGRKRKI